MSERFELDLLDEDDPFEIDDQAAHLFKHPNLGVDDVWRSIGAQVVRTPVRAPNANAYAERWIGTARRECLDHLLIVGPRHLDRVLSEFIEHYNGHRPHRALGLLAPEPRHSETQPVGLEQIVRHDVLGGLIHEYDLVA